MDSRKEKKWQSSSGIPLKACYGPEDVPGTSSKKLAGQAPYLRGVYPEGYRTKAWRIFQLSGFGKPEDENERIKFLLEQGETGFIMEHDRNTADHLYNVDHPDVVARREDVGLTGAVMQSIRDTAICMNELPIHNTFGHAGGAVVQHAPFALAAYWTVAKQRGCDLNTLPGTGQSDFFLTYLGCVTKQQVPTAAGLRMNIDIVEFCAKYLRRWVPISIAGYNGADTGLNAYQELAAVFANAIEYLDEVKRRGQLSIEQAARGISGVNFRVGMDFFEDICKLRAARKMWHDLLHERYGVTDAKATQLRLHIVTAGSMMTYQQPLNNIVRGTLMGLASVLGGTQSLGISGYDEALSVPSEHAHQMSLRVQQIIYNETNIDAVVDPLGGSYFIENLTVELQERAWEFLQKIEDENGFLATLDSGWLHRHAHENQFTDMASQADGSKKIVGVTDYQEDVSPFHVDGFQGSDDAFEVATERLRTLKRERSNTGVTSALHNLETACKGSDNLMPFMMDALESEVTLGEIGEVFRDAFGDWDTPIPS